MKNWPSWNHIELTFFFLFSRNLFALLKREP